MTDQDVALQIIATAIQFGMQDPSDREVADAKRGGGNSAATRARLARNIFDALSEQGFRIVRIRPVSTSQTQRGG